MAGNYSSEGSLKKKKDWIIQLMLLQNLRNELKNYYINWKLNLPYSVETFLDLKLKYETSKHEKTFGIIKDHAIVMVKIK